MHKKDKYKFAIDLDGTLAQETGFRLDEIGLPFRWTKEFVSELRKLGEVFIYSCRTSEEVYGMEAKWNKKKIQEWLDLHGIEVDYIYDGNGKPSADFYIDNRAVRCEGVFFIDVFNFIKDKINSAI